MMTATEILTSILDKKYSWNTRPEELNIIGIRSDSTLPDRFDDFIHLIYKTEAGELIHHQYPATTDPGTYWLQNPLNPQGTAILEAGQYVNAYQIGLHRGLYTALVQVKPVNVMRDYERVALMDFMNGNTYTGLFGINIHHANNNGITKTVDRHSAGCQVFADINDFNEFMGLCEKHKALYGNNFTYTLLDERAESRNQKRQISYAIAASILAVSIGTIIYY